jgi:3-hydroxybutyryl-CoA dehydrogenase
MVIAVLADDILKEEFLTKQLPENTDIIWADSIRSLTIIDADIYFDLLFEFDQNRILQLQKILPKPVVINSVIYTTKETDERFIRINAWPTMLKRGIIETAGQPFPDELQWQCQQVPDITGMVTPRITAMIINEAWFTFGDGISSKEEIDIAMKLGTNYPFGPFEWGEKIGIKDVVHLLTELKRTGERYVIAPALLKETSTNAPDFKY